MYRREGSGEGVDVTCLSCERQERKFREGAGVCSTRLSEVLWSKGLAETVGWVRVRL